MMANDPRFKVLPAEDRSRILNARRLGLETELCQHEANRIGAADPASFDARIGEIEAALAELDRIDAVE